MRAVPEQGDMSIQLWSCEIDTKKGTRDKKKMYKNHKIEQSPKWGL